MISVICDLIQSTFCVITKSRFWSWWWVCLLTKETKPTAIKLRKKKIHVQDIPRAPNLCTDYSRYCSLYFAHMSSCIYDQVLLITVYTCNFHHQTIPAIINTDLLSIVINFNFTGTNRENNTLYSLTSNVHHHGQSWAVQLEIYYDGGWNKVSVYPPDHQVSHFRRQLFK